MCLRTYQHNYTPDVPPCICAFRPTRPLFLLLVAVLVLALAAVLVVVCVLGGGLVGVIVVILVVGDVGVFVGVALLLWLLFETGEVLFVGHLNLIVFHCSAHVFVHPHVLQ